MLPSLIIAGCAFVFCANAGHVEVEVPTGISNDPTESNLLNASQIVRPGGLDEGVEKIPKVKKPRKKLSTRWTTKPSCVSDDSGQEFCVYTNSNFANGRGISFFTTEEISESVKDLAAFSEEGVHDEVNVFSDPPWEVRNIPGRGNGLFATRKLERGDLIIADTPLGVYNSDAFFADYGLGYQYLRKTYDQLPEESRVILMSTAAHSPGDPIMERINTNAFAGEFEGQNHFFLYPETALMNHDCRPNSMYYHNTSSLIHSAHASRTINPGEEITITYINLLQSGTERQEILKMMWGFDCTCELCSGSELSKARSDMNIEKIVQYHKDLADWTSSSPASPQLAEHLLELYNKEHLYAALGTGHMFASLAFNAVGNVDMAFQHAEKALEAGMVSSGSVIDDVEEMKTLMKGPKVHWSFMARARMG
ncbi:putative N-lysine methyltransferase SMYD2 [Amylocarpus encephaloides]|uniref:N-lysine methyltransferase SMYD2 n=1 Tax=Amylocarpus encephaloides TaxID=45428 RepID=A0A9P7YA37_9HELO|nr:putative N-lysine methyltransferase SMYD2 [Amylocarpus encephaloides]